MVRSSVWSHGCQSLYGWTAEAAIGQSSHVLLKTVFPTPLRDIEVALLRDGTWTGELHQRTRDGRAVIVAARKVLIREADGRLAIMENVTDITAQRQAEAALADSEGRFRSTFEQAAVGMAHVGLDGRWLRVNQRLYTIVGYTEQELLARTFQDITHPDDLETDLNQVRALLAGDIATYTMEKRYIRKDRRIVWANLTVSLLRDADGQPRHLISVIEDISDRKTVEADMRHAEAALAANEARLRLVQTVGGIAAMDRTLPNGEMVISEEFVKLYGLPPGQTRISLADFLLLVHPDDCKRMQLEADAVYKTGGTYATEFRIYRPDGAVRWVAIRAEVFLGENGKPQRVISAHRDITDSVGAREELERQVAERTAALAEAEARFRAIFNSQFQMIGLLDPDGTMLEANRVTSDVTGLRVDEIRGRPFWEGHAWPDSERDRVRREVAEAASGALVRREAEIVGADGRGIWIDYSLKPVRDDVTKAVKWIIPEGRDITPLRHLAAELAQAQKVEALGQLAGGIAHDFNNILQAVDGAATLIARRPDDPARIVRLAKIAIDAVARGASITHRLLSFARKGELRIKALATAELLNNVREVLAHTLGTTVSVRCTVPANLPPVVADRSQLETALVNLGTNARDAMPGGGVVTLSAEAERVEADDRHLAGLAPGAYVRLVVADTGTGMDEATLARATEAFFTTKPPGLGTGLGLPMVKAFAERSGGAFAIASAPGEGTRVTLWVPQAASEPAERMVTPVRDRVALDAPSRILLVDDDDMVRETLAAQLEDLGLHILVASSGAEALALLAHEAVDALVSDLSMPDMNGVTTIEKARTLCPGLPCFLLTGYIGERAALSAGDAFTLVHKPVSAEALIAQVEAGLEAQRRQRA